MTVLLLAGTAEARQVAQKLHQQNISAIATLSGATRHPKSLPIPVQIGGFGGADGFKQFISSQNIHAVLDATHPFAHNITDRTHRICHDISMPYALLLRQKWIPDTGDDWHHIACETQAQHLVSPDDIVFLATGRQHLDRFAALNKCRIYCRQIDPPDTDFPFENGDFVIGRPPFSIEEEMRLFKRLKVSVLVVKNAGGQASASKLVAARALGIKVIMIDRPKTPDAHKVETAQQAVDWITSL